MKKIALTLCAVFGLSLAASVLACDAGDHKTHSPAPSAPAAPAPSK